MKVNYPEIRNVYGIKIKTFEPECRIKGYILALHGFCGDMESSVINQLAERMTSHGLAVAAFNFPGHGTSEADEYFSLYNCRKDMSEVINYANKKYGFESPDAVFATSFGGYVTLQNMNDIPAETKIILRAPAVNMQRSFGKFINNMAVFRKNGQQIMGFERKLTVPYSFYTELENNYILEHDFQRSMLIIHGDRDDIVLPEDMKIFCQNNPFATLEVIKGADHRFKGNDYLKQIIDIAEKYIINV